MSQSDEDLEVHTIEEIHEAFRHTRNEIHRMRPFDQMDILQTRIDLCKFKIYELGQRLANRNMLIDVFYARRARMRREGNGTKSLGITIVTEQLKKVKIHASEIRRDIERYKILKSEAETMRSNVLKEFGEKMQLGARVDT